MADDASVAELLRPLMPFFKKAGTTEVCINEPGIVFVECQAEWTRHSVPEFGYDRCLSLAVAIATYTNQDISHERPILSATLPGGERIQVVIPPACERDKVSITIRFPSYVIKTLDEFEREGAFEHARWLDAESYVDNVRGLSEVDECLVSHIRDRNYRNFFEEAVKFRKNIAIVGDTGSGKTTFMKSICQSIPITDRVITIEDVRELLLPNHPNCVHLLYSKDGQGSSNVTPASLIASTLRMKPDRVLLAELRGAEAFDFLKLLTTGHAGSVTSYHARSCALALERFVLMARENAQANLCDGESLHRLVSLTVDIIVHFVRTGIKRYVSEFHFNPLHIHR